jgi:hypothetical protein
MDEVENGENVDIRAEIHVELSRRLLLRQVWLHPSFLSCVSSRKVMRFIEVVALEFSVERSCDGRCIERLGAGCGV